MIERPTLHALALFLAVSKHGTMTAAAQAEQISQPAITAQIKALERYFGTQLLERGGRGRYLTPSGRLVTDYGQRVLALVDELSRAVADLEQLTTGQLVIGASSTVGEQLLPAYLGRFHREHPGVALEVKIGNTDEIIKRVLHRELDFAFVGRAPADPALIAEPVFADDIIAFVAPGDPRLAHLPLCPSALAGQQFVMREQGSATRELAERCLRAAGCSPGHIIELGSNEAVKRAVEAGLGVGLLSTHAIEAERLAELLVDLPLDPWSCHRSFWLIIRDDRTLTRAEQTFLALIRPKPRPDVWSLHTREEAEITRPRGATAHPPARLG
ncbi:MAG: LysR family transcriptional regulator [Chloroflexota bacterium]|nr:LysR family transcriptional regulator [Chloroflexota bacterium]